MADVLFEDTICYHPGRRLLYVMAFVSSPYYSRQGAFGRMCVIFVLAVSCLFLYDVVVGAVRFFALPIVFLIMDNVYYCVNPVKSRGTQQLYRDIFSVTVEM